MKFKEYLKNDIEQLDEGFSSMFTRLKRKLITKIYKKNPGVAKLKNSISELEKGIKELEKKLSPEDLKWVKSMSLDAESIANSIVDDVITDINKEYTLELKKK